MCSLLLFRCDMWLVIECLCMVVSEWKVCVFLFVVWINVFWLLFGLVYLVMSL